MNERRALIVLFVAVVAVEVLILGGLAAIGADTETAASLSVLWACAGRFGVGGIITHYR